MSISCIDNIRPDDIVIFRQGHPKTVVAKSSPYTMSTARGYKVIKACWIDDQDLAGTHPREIIVHPYSSTYGIKKIIKAKG